MSSLLALCGLCGIAERIWWAESDSRRKQRKNSLNSHRSPCSCTGRSWGEGCASCGSCAVSWGGPGRSSSFPHRLGKRRSNARGFNERISYVTAGTGQMSDRQPLPVHLPAPMRTPRCGTGWLRDSSDHFTLSSNNCDWIGIFLDEMEKCDWHILPLDTCRMPPRWRWSSSSARSSSSQEKISIGTGGWLARLRFQLPARFASFSAGLRRQKYLPS